MVSNNVGVVANIVYEDTVLEYIPEDNLATYQSDTVALQDLSAGTDRLHMVLTDKIVGLVQIDENELDIKAVGDFIFEEKIGAAVRKGNQELLDEINHALEAIKIGRASCREREWSVVRAGTGK